MCSSSGDTVLGQVRHQGAVLRAQDASSCNIFYNGKDLGINLHCTLKNITNSNIHIFVIQSQHCTLAFVWLKDKWLWPRYRCSFMNVLHNTVRSVFTASCNTYNCVWSCWLSWGVPICVIILCMEETGNILRLNWHLYHPGWSSYHSVVFSGCWSPHSGPASGTRSLERWTHFDTNYCSLPSFIWNKSINIYAMVTRPAAHLSAQSLCFLHLLSSHKALTNRQFDVLAMTFTNKRPEVTFTLTKLVF